MRSSLNVLSLPGRSVSPPSRPLFASVMASIKQLGKSKYGQEQIAATLNKFFGGRVLGECKTALLVPSFNIETGEIYAFRSGGQSPFDSDSQTSALDAALATTAAPTFFPAHRTQSGTPLVDGASAAAPGPLSR